jgi:phosphatidate cytidylyltransferase
LTLKNFAFRTLVAVIGIPLILIPVYKGGLLFLGLVLIITTMAQYEFYKLAEKKSCSPLKLIGIFFGIITTLLFYRKGIMAISYVLPISLLTILLVELFRNKPNATLNITTSLTGIFYPTTLFSFFLLIRELPKRLPTTVDYYDGGRLILVVLITIWICDTAAYLIGSAIGKHKLYQRISPNKTVEGAIAGFIFSLITVGVFYLVYPKLLSLQQYLVIGVLIGIFAQLGDLVESIFKRDVGVKDSSALLPGHGGFFDRFDAPTYVAPIIYFYLIYFVYYPCNVM